MIFRLSVTAWKKALGQRLDKRLQQVKVTALAEESERYRSRQGEISRLIQNNKIEMIRREIDEVKNDLDQGFLFAEFTAERARLQETLEEELSYRTHHCSRNHQLFSPFSCYFAIFSPFSRHGKAN